MKDDGLGPVEPRHLVRWMAVRSQLSEIEREQADAYLRDVTPRGLRRLLSMLSGMPLPEAIRFAKDAIAG